jgi:Amt family ammonium transporter
LTETPERKPGSQTAGSDRVWRLGLPVLVFVTILFSGLGLWWLVEQGEDQLLAWQIANAIDRQLGTVERDFAYRFKELIPLGSLFQSSGHVTPDEFAIFAEGILRPEAGLRALLWAPLTADREVSCPVAYVASTSGLPGFRGLDLMAEPAIKDALARARTTGQLTLSDRIRLGSGRDGFVALWPVVSKAPRPPATDGAPNQLLGFVAGVYDVPALIDAALGSAAAAGLQLVVTDLEAPPDRQQLFGPPSPATSGERPQAPARSQRLRVGDRQWEVRYHLGRELLGRSRRWAPLVALTATLAVTLLLGNSATTLARVRETIAARRVLRDLETRYRAVLETVAEALVAVNGEGLIEVANPAMERLFGYARGELLGRELNILMPAQHRARHTAHLARLVARGRERRNMSRCAEGLGVRKDGSTFPIEVTSNAVRLGDKYFLTAIVRDISDRKRAEEERRTHEQQTLLLKEIAVAANEAPSLEEAFGLVLEKVCRHADWAVGHAYVVAAEASVLTSSRVWYVDDPEARRGFQEISERLRFCVNEGLPGQVLTSAQPCCLANLDHDPECPQAAAARAAGLRAAYALPVLALGRVTAVLEFFSLRAEPLGRGLEDLLQQVGLLLGQVLQRQQALEALRKNEEFLRSLLERSPMPLAVESVQHEVTFLNRRFTDVFGYTGEDVHSFNDWCRCAFPDETYRDTMVREWFRRVQDAVLNRREVEPMLADVTCKDGSIRHVEFCFASVGYRTLVVFNDLTERLETQEALRRAKEDAERANRAKSQFLASVSHELRTPLNGVIGMTELLKTTALDERQQRYLLACHNSATSLLGLINDILDFSKIEAGKLQLDHHEFELDRLVEETADLLAPRAHEKGLELVCLIDRQTRVSVVGDGFRLRQVLINLIGNAIKFTDVGEIRVQVQAAGSDGDELFVMFAVSDTGIGIANEHTLRLFQPFSQGDDSTTRKYGGTGLGLAISKSLAEMMGGEIGVTSEAGRGSTFWFTAHFLRSSLPGGPAVVRGGRLHGQKVLVVDDNTTVRQQLQDDLASWGMNVQTAASADEALHRVTEAEVARQPFQLVITDLGLPGRDGRSLAKQLRTHDALPVVMLTSLDTLFDSRERLELGVEFCLPKPVKHVDLWDAVTSVLSPHPERQRSAPAPDEASLTVPADPSAHRGRLLLAEDNEVNRMYVGEVLQSVGYHCDLATTGRQAVAAVQQKSYDLVLMDCQMPEMDGFEAARVIRELEQQGLRSGHLPIVALTANALRGDRERCLAAGMDDYVSKPVHPGKLLALIETTLRRLHPEQFVAATPPARDLGAHRVPDSSAAGDAAALEEATPPPDAGSGEPEAPAPIHLDALYEQCLGHLDFAQSLLAEFITVGAERVDRIAQCLAEGNAQSLAEVAHSLKGSAAIVAAGALQQVAADLEGHGRAGRLEEARQHLPRLRQELQRCVNYLGRGPAGNSGDSLAPQGISRG